MHEAFKIYSVPMDHAGVWKHLQVRATKHKPPTFAFIYRYSSSYI